VILSHLSMLGLVHIFHPEKDERRAKFYVPSLLQQFLMSSTGQSGNFQLGLGQLLNTDGVDEELRAAELGSSEKFIIVETNFKVYAYTRSKIYLALLKLIMRVEYAFPNLIVSTLTRSNLYPAFERGISAKQVIDFLESHAHIGARMDKLAMMQ